MASGGMRRTRAKASAKALQARSAREWEEARSGTAVTEGGAARRWWLKRAEGRRLRRRMAMEEWRRTPAMEVKSRRRGRYWEVRRSRHHARRPSRVLYIQTMF